MMLVIDYAVDPKDVVAAARALVDSTRGAERPATSELETVSDEELTLMAAQASATLERTTQ